MAFEAIRYAKVGDLVSARKKLDESKEKQVIAHNENTKIMVSDINNENSKINILLIHAQTI